MRIGIESDEVAVTFPAPKSQIDHPKIDGKLLDPSDLGRWVTYTASHGGKERGILSSFRANGAIYVRFKGPHGERCPAENLTWG